MASSKEKITRLLAFCMLCLPAVSAKVFERCELAKLLKDKHRLSLDEVANWVCIAQHQSNFNSALRTGGPDNGAHGLFQISDQFWCSPPGRGDACGVSCDRLRDDDLTDDIACVRKIHDEHQRISGDGYNAWTMYQRFCKGRAKKLVEDCFNPGNPKRALDRFESSLNTLSFNTNTKKSKIYDRCELANELRYKHNFPVDQIATWVCIVKHESNFNTSAIGRLNVDGSDDHGLFQISDIYWCSPPGQGLACGISCSQLEDSDITDDVDCVKKIYEEHTRISGDGFNAWTTYQPYCKGRSESYIQGCFKDTDDTTALEFQGLTHYERPQSKPSKPGKVYTPCELATELRDKFKIPREQIATWVCIAKHESNFNTSAIGRLNADGSGDHGLFQISDIYWCSPPGNGWACRLSCSDLENSDITDDVECIKRIYEEHTRLSGDGFNAWAVYNPYCKGKSESFVNGCFSDNDIDTFGVIPAVPDRGSHRSPSRFDRKRGKVYTPCELAKELRNKYNIPLDQIDTWVCIAKHESNFNTSAIGRLNSDGSGDHGLFQISDIYWCSPPGNGWACGLSCSDLEDSDITDDVECIKKIHAEHTRLSGDGFNAWAVYNPYCKGRSDSYIKGCFDDYADVETNTLAPVTETKSVLRGPAKIYSRCELAEELRVKHRMPEDQIATWVCIAEHESNLNTGAMNAGSGDHGLFQISQLYWCDTSGPGKECRTDCAKFRDNDITDDIQCIKKIYKEHSRLSGDGFNAWVVYPQRCKGRSQEYVKGCSQYQQPSETTKRPPIIVPAITAPTDLLIYRDKFLKFPTSTKAPAHSFKFADFIRKPPVFESPFDKQNLIATPASHIFDDKFFSTRISFDKIAPSVQPQVQKHISSTIQPKPTPSAMQFWVTAGSRFNLPPATPSTSRLSTTRKPFVFFTDTPTTVVPTANIFNYFTKPIKITPRTTIPTKQLTRTTTSKADRFAGFAGFDATSRFKTTKALSKYEFASTTPQPLATRPTSRYYQPFIDRTPTTTIAPRPTSTESLQIFIPSYTPKTFTNIFDFYFDLYKLQRQPIDIPSPKFDAARAHIHQQTTKLPFWAQNREQPSTKAPFAYQGFFTTTRQPFQATEIVSTPAFRGFRFGTAYDANASQQPRKVTTKRPFTFEDVQATNRLYNFRNAGQVQKDSKFSQQNIIKEHTTTKSPAAFRGFSTLAPAIEKTALPIRGFRFGSAFTSGPESFAGSTTRRPFRFEDTTSSRTTFRTAFSGSNVASGPVESFQNAGLSQTRNFFDRNYDNSSPRTQFSRGHSRFSTTRTPSKGEEFGFSTFLTNENPTPSAARKSFRFVSRFHSDDEHASLFDVTTTSPRNAFDELFERFVH